MRDFKGTPFDHTEAGLEALLRHLCRERGSAADVSVQFVALPPASVAVAFGWPNRVTVQIPEHYSSAERRGFFLYRFLCAWPIFVAARARFADLEGRCQLWLDDMPGGPGLAFCGNAVSTMLVPDPVFLDSRGYLYLSHEVATLTRPWPERRDRVFWRGVSSGSRHHLRVAAWSDLPRLRLCLKARAWDRDDLLDIGLSEIAQIFDPREIAAIEAARLVRGKVPQLAFAEYRYAIDIDGNSSSWPGLFSKLVMGATVIKVDSFQGYRQWYYDRLIPWKNFVPLSGEMDELVEVAEWLRAHPPEAEAIGWRGQELAASLSFERVLDDTAARLRDFLAR